MPYLKPAACIAFALFILSLAAWADAEPPTASATAVVSSSENG